MKTIKQTILGLALSVISITAYAQCPSITNLNVTYGVNGTATITPVLSGTVSSLAYYFWNSTGNYSQNASSLQPNATFQFQNNGTYSVCLNLKDSLNNCWSNQFCDTITISNLPPVSCNAAFSSYTDSACVTHFVNSSTGTNLTYEWYDVSNGFSLISTAINPTATFPNGTYLISLYTNSNGQYCDSVTKVVTVGCATNTNTPSNCQAYFTAYTDSNCVTHLYNQSSGSNLTYQWNVNGQSYNTTNTSVNLSNGLNYISLFTYSNGQFCDSTVQTINVACGSGSVTPTSCQANSLFWVFSDSTNTGNYFAYNLSSGTGNLSYSWDFGDGTSSTQQYPFHNYATPGQYIICLTVTAANGTTTCTDIHCDSSSVSQRIASGFLMSQVNVVPQSTTGIKQTEMLTALNAYPNPMADELTIETIAKGNGKLNYNLIDALGRIILTGDIENSKATINTSALEKGFYSLNITNEKGSSLKAIKLVK